MAEKAINFIDLLAVLTKHRRFIVATVFTITILALILSLIWPKKYKSTARVLPPPRETMNMGGLFGSLMQNVTPKSPKIDAEAVLVLVESRTLKEKTIKEFNFQDIYNIDVKEALLKKFKSNLIIDVIREGGFGFNPVVAIELSFTDRKPERAEQVVHFYINNIDSMYKKLNFQRTINNYQSIQTRFQKNLNDLKKAELALKEFQEKYGVFEIETQLTKMIDQIAKIKTKITENEVKINVLKEIYGDNNNQLQQLKSENKALKVKLNQLITTSERITSNQVFHPLYKMPELMLKYGQLYREVTVQNKIYEMLYPQYEQLKMEIENEDIGLQVIDNAQIPTYKSSPKRLYIVLAGFLFSIFISLFIVFLKETIQSSKEKNSENYNKLIKIKDAILNDLIFWKKNVH